MISSSIHSLNQPCIVYVTLFDCNGVPLCVGTAIAEVA